MGRNVTHQLIEAHRVDGKIAPKEQIALRIDQTLTQDTAGTMVMLEFEAMGVPHVKTEISAQYVDHNLLQTDFKNADDHLFLLSACLSAMDRHVIANIGTEHGATSTVFPSDDAVRRFLKTQGRDADWIPTAADGSAAYDETDKIDLSGLEPLIALPSSPGNVVPVREVAGREIYQTHIGPSANPGLKDFAVPALMVDGAQVHERVSFDVNPTSRQILENLATLGLLQKPIGSGALIHQAGCNGCIGMGQAPAVAGIPVELEKEPNIKPLPSFEPLAERIAGPAS